MEAQYNKKRGAMTQETALALTLDTNRGRQVVSKRDVAKVKTHSVSCSPRTNKQRVDSRSLERKIAAFKDAEDRSEMELNKRTIDFPRSTDMIRQSQRSKKKHNWYGQKQLSYRKKRRRRVTESKHRARQNRKKYERNSKKCPTS